MYNENYNRMCTDSVKEFLAGYVNGILNCSSYHMEDNKHVYSGNYSSIPGLDNNDSADEKRKLNNLRLRMISDTRIISAPIRFYRDNYVILNSIVQNGSSWSQLGEDLFLATTVASEWYQDGYHGEDYQDHRELVDYVNENFGKIIVSVYPDGYDYGYRVHPDS